jgi:hypothetical protein
MSNIDPNELPPLDVSALEDELRKEQEYGGRPGEAFAGQAASTATFGLSDAALVAAGVDPERLREVREREAVASGLGTATGIIAPAVATLGTSTAAQVAAAPVRAATAVGTAAEKLAVKALPESAKAIGSTTARAAAEGAAYGTGELISDVALEKRDLSAESLLGTVGAGTLFGAGFGSVMGAAQATVPSLLKKASKIGAQTKSIAKQATEGIVDNNKLAARLFAKTDLQSGNLIDDLGKYSNELADFAKRDLNYEGLDTAASLLQKNKNLIKSTGEELGNIANLMDEKAREQGAALITREEAWMPVYERLEELKKGIKLKGVRSDELKAIEIFQDEIKQTMLASRKVGKIDKARADAALKRQFKLKNEYDKLSALANPSYAQQLRMTAITKEAEGLEALLRTGTIERVPFSFKEFNDKRIEYDGIKFPVWMTEESNKVKARIAAEVRKAMREQTNIIAEKLEAQIPGISGQLKNANKRYHIANEVKPYLEDAANAAPDITSPVALAFNTAARVARNNALIFDIGKKTESVLSVIKSSVDSAFLKGTEKTKKLSFPSTGVLVRSQLSADENGNRPTTRKEAFNNLQKNITNVTANPEQFVDLLAKKTSRVSNANSEVGMVLQQRLATAVNFLNSKMPKPAVVNGMFKREHTPSSMELAKFERYVQIVEQPLTALDELKNGTLTREHVEALQAVYPEIYKQMQMAVMDKISAGDTKLSYAKKLQIGILLNIPADSSLQPETILQLQQSINPQSEQPQTGPQFRPSGMEQTGISERMQSGTEALSNRD